MGSPRLRAGAGSSLAGDERIGRDRLAVFLHRKHPSRRSSRAIGAADAGTDGARGPHWGCGRIHEIQAVRVSDARRIADVAAEPDCKQGIVAKVGADWALYRPADGEEAL